MRSFFVRLEADNALLFWFGLINFTLAISFYILTHIINREVLGVNAWFKPFKFALSIALYTWTIAWFIRYLPGFNSQLFSWCIILLLGFEISYIAIQAGRGQLSHFNTKSSFYGSLYVLMALAATAVSLYTAYIGFLFFKYEFPELPLHYVWSIRLGILLFVIFSLEGFVMGSRMTHTIGAADGGEGFPIVNWSKQHGDARVAHFIGMHALQVLPLLSFYIVRNLTGIIVIAIFYGLLADYTLLQALYGKPVYTTNKMNETF